MFYVMKINTIKDFEKCLASLGYTEDGGYPIYFITADGGCLSFTSAVENAERIKDEIENGDFLGWRVIASDVNWGYDLYCDHSGEKIKSANGEQEIG